MFLKYLHLLMFLQCFDDSILLKNATFDEEFFKHIIDIYHNMETYDGNKGKDENRMISIINDHSIIKAISINDRTDLKIYS
jgi:hypothetical protein